MAKGSRRDLHRQRYWQDVVQRQLASGQRVRPWCRSHQVPESGFYFWRRELARRGVPVAAEASVSAGFVPVAVTADRTADAGGRIEIVLGDRRCVRLIGPVDREALADVIAVLEDRAAPGIWRLEAGGC